MCEWRDETHVQVCDTEDCPVPEPEPELVVGAILAWRQWGLGNEVSWLREHHGISVPNNTIAQIGSLKSVGVGGEWTSHEEIASCDRSAGIKYGSHKAPHKDCMCGLYAFKFDDLIRKWDNGARVRNIDSQAADVRNTIYGAIALTGKVIEHELGYRAEKAAMMKLWCNRSNFEGKRAEPSLIVLHERYGPVNTVEVVDDVFDAMLSWRDEREAK